MKILTFVLSCIIIHSFAQDRGGLNTLTTQSETSGLNADLKKKVAFSWVLDKQLNPQDCYLDKSVNFFLNLNEDGSFTSQSWGNVKRTDLFGDYDATLGPVFPNKAGNGTWSISDFILTLRYENEPPVRVKVLFKTSDKIALQGSYTDQSKERKFTLPFTLGTGKDNIVQPSPTGASTEDKMMSDMTKIMGSMIEKKEEAKPLSENGASDPANYIGYWSSIKFQTKGTTTWNDPSSNKDYFILELKSPTDAHFTISSKKNILQGDYNSKDAVWALVELDGKQMIQFNDPGTGEDFGKMEVLKMHQATGKTYLTVYSQDYGMNILFLKQR